MERRSFFKSLLGAPVAATLAEAGIPEPEKVESLKPGGIYAVHLDTHLSVRSMEMLSACLTREGERLGVKFIAFDPGMRLAKLEPK